MIPKIIHFMWLDKKDPYTRGCPDKYKPNLQKWINMNPDAKVVLWNYEDVENEFPEYMEHINNIPAWISKCDMARFLILQKYGGIYSDLDFIPLRPIDSTVWDRDIFLINEPRFHVKKNEKGRLFNGFVGSKPAHPFIEGWVKNIIDHIEDQSIVWNVMDTTGPRSFYKYYTENPIVDLDPEDACRFIPVVRPVENNLKGEYFVNPDCNSVEPFCYTTWVDGTNWGMGEYLRIIKKLAPYILLVLVILFVLYKRYRKNRGRR